MPPGLRRYHTYGNEHFLTFSCYQRKPYLDSDHARIIFEEELERLRQRHKFFVFAYVLMPEHVHLVVSEPKAYLLSTTLNVLKADTAKKLKGERKHFWQARYYDFNVFTQRKMVEKIRYIHRNPVARGMVEKPEDWPWSSFRHWLTGEPGRVEIESHWTWDRREREQGLLPSVEVPTRPR